MATNKELQSRLDDVLASQSVLIKMVREKDDESARILAKLHRPSYRKKPTSFEVKLQEDDEGNYVTVGELFELYRTISGSWTVRVIGIGMNQYAPFAELVPPLVQVEAINLLFKDSQ